MKVNPRLSELIFLAVLIISAVVIFYLQFQIPANETTDRERFLFNGIEFGFSLGIGFYLQKIESRRQYLSELKRFAISAYRRITDIGKIVNRLQSEINPLIAQVDNNNEIQTINAYISALSLTIDSSISDWVDIIGDELHTIDRITQLQEEKKILDMNGLPKSGELSINKFNKLDKQIEELKELLPDSLKLSMRSVDIPSQLDNQVKLLQDLHYRDNGLVLNVVGGHGHGDTDWEDINIGDKFVSNLLYSGGIDVFDENRRLIGRILNTFGQGNYDDFGLALKGCYGDCKLELEAIYLSKVSSLSADSTEDKKVYIYNGLKLKVLNPPNKTS